MSLLTADVIAALNAFHQVADGPALWPGFAPATTPLCLHGPAGALLVGHPSPPPGYSAVGSVAGRPILEGPLLPGMLGNTASVVAGSLCALAGLPGGGQPAGDDYVRLLVHECFHVFQGTGLGAVERPGMAAMTLMARYPENDSVNNSMAIVENRLLAAAIGGEMEAVAAFVAVRQARHALLDPAISAYETLQEYNEGTATYIEVRAGQPIEALTAGLLEHNRGGKSAAYRRFYDTGAVMALLLDRLSPGWQRRFADGGVTIEALLTEVAGPATSAPEVLAAAGYGGLLAEEQEAEVLRQVRVSALLAQLRTGPGVPVVVEIPEMAGLGWDPTNLLMVEPGVRLHTRWCAIMAGGSIRLEVTGLCLEEQTARRLTFRLPTAPVGDIVATGLRIAGDGLTGEAPAGAILPWAGPDDAWLIQLRGTNRF